MPSIICSEEMVTEVVEVGRFFGFDVWRDSGIHDILNGDWYAEEVVITFGDVNHNMYMANKVSATADTVKTVEELTAQLVEWKIKNG